MMTVKLFLFLAILTPLATCAIYNADCISDQNCFDIYTDEYRCIEQHCKRKPFSFNFKELLGAIAIIGISMVANAGGLGAGAVIIPVYMFFYGFVTTDSIPLSKITIFAGAIINFAFNWNTRDNFNKNKFIIMYELASVMIPLLLGGTMIGVMLSKFLPAILISSALILYLVLSMLKLYKRGMALHREEEKQNLELTESFNPQSEGIELKDKDQYINPGNQESFHIEDDGEVVEDIFPDHYLAKKQMMNAFSMILAFGVILLTALLRGGEGKPSIIGLDECSFFSFLILFCSQVVVCGIAYQSYQRNKEKIEEEDNTFGSKSEAMDKRKKLLIASYFTGMAAGTLGIGGGMILGPFMLSMEMEPTISTALSGFTVLFTSSSTTSQFIIAGAIHFEHAWFFMVMSLIGSIFGIFILKALISYYQKPSILIWVIFGILVMASIVMPSQAIFSIISGKQGLFEFGSIC